MNIDAPFTKTKFDNIVRHPVGLFNRTKPTYTGIGTSGKKYFFSSNGTWYSTYVNNKKIAIGYKLDEVSKALEQL
jgi:hypothetical protein